MPEEAASTNAPRRSGIARIVRLLFAALFIAVLVRFFRGVDLGEQVRQFDWRFAVLSLLLSGAMVSISTWKWKVLLGQQGHALSFPHLLRVYFIGYYFSNFLPSNFGGDVVRSLYTGRRIGSQQRAAIAVFLERFTGLILLLVLVVNLRVRSIPKLLVMTLGTTIGCWLIFEKVLGIYLANGIWLNLG